MDTSAGQCHFYSDGQVADTDEFVSVTTVFATGAGLNNLYIGGLDGSHYLNADIDEVRIYTAARTQAEIQADMNTPIGGAPPGDTTPPVISGVNAGSIGATSANIAWTTNENSDSQVEYGTITAYGQSTTLNPSLVTAHSQGLSGLTAGTLYHYRVKSKDAAGNLRVSGDFTFTTAQSQSIPLDGLANLSYNTVNNRINTAGFEYHPNGNQIRAVIDASGAQQQYRYDCANRLVQVSDGSGNVLATHEYGAGNQRLKSVEGGVTRYFSWAGGQISAEYDASGANALVWKTSYIYLGGRLLATTSGAGGTETRFHHPDRLGTRLVTDTAGTVVSEQFTLPFGNMQPFTSVYGGDNPYQNPTLSNPSKKRFTSYDRSDATRLDYAVNRFYSPQQGRFTQVDPIGMGAAELTNPQSLNLYAYCLNNPVNSVDPTGLLIIFCDVRVIGQTFIEGIGDAPVYLISCEIFGGGGGLIRPVEPFDGGRVGGPFEPEPDFSPEPPDDLAEARKAWRKCLDDSLTRYKNAIKALADKQGGFGPANKKHLVEEGVSTGYQTWKEIKKEGGLKEAMKPEKAKKIGKGAGWGFLLGVLLGLGWDYYWDGPKYSAEAAGIYRQHQDETADCNRRAREAGLNLGPPTAEERSREWVKEQINR
jgi:RHS repeat-associated protein